MIHLSETMTFEIKEVSTKKEMKRFARFPLQLYKNHPQYVPSLVGDEIKSIWNSPSLNYCQQKAWIAYNNRNKVIGRIVGIVNPRANELYGYKRIRFGWFDVVDDFSVAEALLKTVINWGAGLGMTEIHGPLGYNTWNKQGMMIEGFERIPQFNCIYNYPYYPKFLERMGFAKELDWLQYIMPAQQPVPDKIERINSLIMKKYDLRLLKWKGFKDIEPYLDDFFSMYNDSFMTVSNFIPLLPEEIEAGLKMYIKLLDPELSYFILDSNDKIAAFSISFPSMSQAFRKAGGYLFPFGWFHLLKGYFFYKDIDFMMIGAHPAWKGKGLSSIYHYHTNKTIIKKKLRWAVTNPQLENNQAIEIWKEYDKELHTRRRCYLKTIQ